MKSLGTLGAEGFQSTIWLNDDGRIFFVADADIDSDGGSNPDHDPYWQADTTLHHNGKPIDAETVPGVVVPGWIPRSVGPIVMGCRARITNLRTMQSCDAVVHDLGPKTKDGELTPEAARRVGINPNSVTGGEERPVVLYECWPGVPAFVDGVTYSLQPLRA